MLFGALAGRVAGAVGTGLAGAVAYDGIKRFARSDAAREGAVWIASVGLRGVRAAETGTEHARLGVADIVSEARERIGEQSPAPGGDAGEQAGSGHQH